MAILGNNIIVYMNGTAIAGTRSDEIQVECKTFDISSGTDQDWTHLLAGRKSWSLTAGFLVLANTDVRKLLLTGTKVTLKIKGRNESDSNGITGQAILRIGKMTFSRGTLAQGSFQFAGDGPLT